jgi:adenosine kinase
MARILICGSLAYDDLGTFTSPWTTNTRNIKLDRLDRGFGGCAMNMAYNLAGLGHEAVPLVYAGDDYHGEYARHVTAAGISEAGIFAMQDTPSARGIVLTGADGVQFTAFYPGPSGRGRWRGDLDELLTGAAFHAAIVAPDLPDKMAGCAQRLAHLPFVVWCPGQYAELLTAPDIEAALRGVHLLVANRHEWQALCGRVGAEQLLAQATRVVVTDGPHSITVLPDALSLPVPEVADDGLVDPTGCGDAFVAGLVSALLAGADVPTAVSAGTSLARRCLASRGAQAHSVA